MRTEVSKCNNCDLKNDGNLTLFFIGVGSAFSKRNYQTNLLIIKGQDHLLIDCGTRCCHGLFEAGIKVTDIQNLFITHSHADHIGGLEEIALMGRYFTRKKPRLFITSKYKNMLWNYSLKGGCAYGESRKLMTIDDFFEIVTPQKLEGYERDVYSFDVGNINIKAFRTKHISEKAKSWKHSVWSTGVIIDDRVMFTGDTRFDPNLILQFSQRFPLEVIFHDCQFFVGGVHAGLEELKALPQDIKKKMILVHYGDNWEHYEENVKKYGFMGLGKQQISYIFD